ncbi:peptidoglycan-binding domain-containing protein [Marinobacter adhaerens]|uniref:peptidoglycan-binding domain-containing protein n=1 Tax=Marinobacter adhaerens TaxID=1033846 RepID=UPI003F72FF78
MTRSQSPRRQGVRGPVIAMLTAAACLGTAQAAEPEKVIFAAENALYGAGHDIGRADGWIDEQLRAAIRAYQAQNGLQTNGNLDTATLKALGVTKTSSATITANSVGSRKASVAQLGLSLPEPAPNTPTVARAEPKPAPAPEPTPDPIQKSSEQGGPTTSINAKPVKNQIVTDVPSKRTEVKPQEKVAEAAPKTPEPVTSEHPAPTSAPTSAPAPAPEPAVAEETTPEATKEPDPVLAQLPAEPTSAGPDEPKATDTKKAQPIGGETTASTNSAVADNSRSTGGGFFSVLFDFFFGWLV